RAALLASSPPRSDKAACCWVEPVRHREEEAGAVRLIGKQVLFAPMEVILPGGPPLNRVLWQADVEEPRARLPEYRRAILSAIPCLTRSPNPQRARQAAALRWILSVNQRVQPRPA